MFLLIVVSFLIVALTNYWLYKTLGYEKAWLGFIPFFAIIPLLDIAGMNRWYILLMLIPVVNIIFAIVLMAIPMKRLNGSLILYAILTCISGFSTFYLWFLLYSYNKTKEKQEDEEYEG